MITKDYRQKNICKNQYNYVLYYQLIFIWLVCVNSQRTNVKTIFEQLQTCCIFCQIYLNELNKSKLKTKNGKKNENERKI